MAELTKTTVGLFRGFVANRLEFRADLLTPYAGDDTPLIGSFLLVESHPQAALVGRVSQFRPTGALATAEGDDYLTTMSRLGRQIPEELKAAKLRYTIDLRLLGVISRDGDLLAFTPAIRRLPHLGSPVGIPSDAVMEFLCSINLESEPGVVDIGHLALGDTVFDGVAAKPDLPIRFDMGRLHSRRTFVFARAGYGKSNLVKLLVSRLYEQKARSGTLIFDPEGEYAFADTAGRPGLHSIPEVRDRLVVFTDRAIPPPLRRWVQGSVRFDLAALAPWDVVGLTISAEKQDTVFANRLRGMTDGAWAELVGLIHSQGYRADDTEIGRLTHLNPGRDAVVINAVRSNLVPVVRTLHDPASDLQAAVLDHLREGRVVVVDLSLASSRTGEQVAGVLLRRIMHYNQRHFVEGSDADMVPAIAIIEEAQSVLSPGASDDSPFVEWAKEGRKYRLGAILVTQQPASIDPRLLSQGDNFFAFHLIAEGDLRALQQVNAHYSDDILAQILHEPIAGNAYLWSAPDQPFVLPARIESFEDWAATRPPMPDPDVTPSETYDRTRKTRGHRFTEAVRAALVTPTVKLFGVILNGDPQPNAVAVKEWNLKFQVADQLDDDLMAAFGIELGDGTDAVRTEMLIEALGPLCKRVVRALDADRTRYIVMSAAVVGDRRPTDTVSLESDAR